MSSILYYKIILAHTYTYKLKFNPFKKHIPHHLQK